MRTVLGRMPSLCVFVVHGAIVFLLPLFPLKATIQIIANGGAKGMADAETRRTFVTLVRETLPDARLDFTEPGADVQKMVRDAITQGATIIVVGGGDGTVNAVASQLVGTDVVLGVLPMGTLNHFAKDVGIPQAIEEALSAVHSGEVLTVDVGQVNDCIFLNNSGLGLYPDMVHNREQRQRRGASKWVAVFVESVRAFARYRVLRLRIKLDGRMLERRTPAVFVGNNHYSLEGTLASKRTSLVEGTLCLYIPHPTTRLGLLWYSLRAFFSNPAADGNFDKLLATDFTIVSHHSKLRVSVDGEVKLMKTPLEYQVKPGALKVMIPRALEVHGQPPSGVERTEPT